MARAIPNRKMSFHFTLISDRSVWHNGKHPDFLSGRTVYCFSIVGEAAQGLGLSLPSPCGAISEKGSEIAFYDNCRIHARSLANFYCQYADRHMNLKFIRHVSERERAIRPFDIVKNKLMSVFNEIVLLLTMNFVMTLSK